MNYQFRLKTYQDEEGEYSEYRPCTKETILNIIEKHWTGDSMPNGLEIICITNGAEHLLLEHQHKYVFEIYFLPIEEHYYHHKKSTIDAVLDSLDLFMTGNTAQLQALNKTKKENDYIRGSFFYLDHNYRYTPRRNWRALDWLILGLPVSLTCLGIAIFMLVVPASFQTGWFSLFFMITFIFSIMGLFIHWQYRKDIDDWVIRVTRGQDKITATLYGNTREWSKKDILRVTKYENPAFRNPWSEYGYTTIEFKSGEIINLTNLMLPQSHTLEKFTGENIEIKTVYSRMPFLKKRMHII